MMYHDVMRGVRFFSLCLLVLGILLIQWRDVDHAQAALESCSVTMTPHIVQTTTMTNFTVTLSNTGSSSILYFEIVSPSANFSIQGKEAAGWSGTSNSSMAQFWGSSLAAGASMDFTVSVQSGGEEAASANWVVRANNVLSADGTTTCTGDTGVAIEGVRDVIAPVIGSQVTVSDVTANSVKISWTTDEASSHELYYGVGGDYDLSKIQSSFTTSHVAELSNLTADTTYTFYFLVIDASGNSSESDEVQFTTAKAGLTGTTTTVTVTQTETVTSTQTQTVTKIITDTTPPSLSIDELINPSARKSKNREIEIFESAPLITGSVSDDRGVSKVEYRIMERETSWSSASLSGEVGAKSTKWEFLPPISLDGSYIIEVRGVDVFGNVSSPKSVEFVIDQLPPTVGGGVVSYGALPLYSESSVVTVMEGREYEVVLYEAGGADQVSLDIQNNKFQFQKMGTKGLWRGLIKFEGEGEIVSRVSAVDGAENETEREWVKFRVQKAGRILQNGEVISDVSIRVFWLDPTTKIYQEWKGEEYGVQHTAGSQQESRWGYVLPKGEYYLEAQVEGDRIISQKLSLDNTTTIGSDWEIGQPKWWEKIFKIRRKSDLTVTPSFAKASDGQAVKPGLQVGRESWIGKKSVVFIGTEDLPWYRETMRRAEQLASEENAQLVKLELQGLDDPRGEWIEIMKVGLLPQVYLVNDKGDTVDYMEGVWER